MKKVLTLSCLVALVMCLNACNRAEADKTIGHKSAQLTVPQAKSLIEEGEKLDSIPKSVWKKLLTSAQYEILWEKGTERRHSGALNLEKRQGVYRTVGCKIPVFRSDHKYESGSGWPSFWEALDKDNIVLKEDSSWGMKRTEVLSACGEHLGHVFEDGPKPTGLRYCINSLALEFVPGELRD